MPTWMQQYNLMLQSDLNSNLRIIIFGVLNPRKHEWKVNHVIALKPFTFLYSPFSLVKKYKNCYIAKQVHQ